jgi:hypothetical protein
MGHPTKAAIHMSERHQTPRHGVRRILGGVLVAAAMMFGTVATSTTAHASPVFDFYDKTWRHGSSPFVNTVCSYFNNFPSYCIAYMSRVDMNLPGGASPKVGQTFYVHLETGVTGPGFSDQFQMRLLMPAGLKPAVTATNPVRCVLSNINPSTTISNAPCGLTQFGIEWQLPAVQLDANTQVDYFVPVVASKSFAGTSAMDCTKSATIDLGVCLQASSRNLTSSYLPNPMVSAVPLTVSGYSKPSAPQSVVGSPRNAAAAISWKAPLSNGGKAITKYTVTASPGGRTCTTTGALGCTITGLVNARIYSFTVKATNAVGTSASSAASVGVKVGTPTAPKSVKVTFPGAGKAHITWLAPTFTGNAPITRYEMKARAYNGAVWTSWSAWTTIGKTLVDNESGLPKGVLFDIQLRAVNKSGGGVVNRFQFVQTK